MLLIIEPYSFEHIMEWIYFFQNFLLDLGLLNFLIQSFSMCFNNTVLFAFLCWCFYVVDVITLLLLIKMIYFWNVIIVGNDLMFFEILVVELYCFGHMVKGKFQISKFPYKIGFAYGIALQSRVSKCASIIIFSNLCLWFLKFFLFLAKNLSFLLVWVEVFVLVWACTWNIFCCPSRKE